MSNEHYLHNSLIHQDRRLGASDNDWVKQFDCTHIKPLIICRGPIRKEAMDVFDEMGIDNYGILLSEKDSIVYPRAIAPELRTITDPSRVHRVSDYSGVDKADREARIQEIIQIAHDKGYNAIFAGYGFMAEDEAMVASMENAGLNFIGPCSRTVRQAGLKDEAKRTALKAGVSVTPGVDNATALTLLKKYPTAQALTALCADRGLSEVDLDTDDVEELADRVLTASYKAGIDIYSIDELIATLKEAVEGMNKKYPNNRVRLKAIGGGGGKGQRIVERGESARTGELVKEILQEVKASGVGDNKNVLVELNIESTRHQEIQVIGNGDWCMTLGGRDCSLQMHEQKLLEVSVTRESLLEAADEVSAAGLSEEAAVLKADVVTLDTMEEEASRFGGAVGLDSVSTFECIVDTDSHFFMEMNTRIQVEHRVSELCYALEFSNPDDPTQSFIVNSLVEAMVLLAAHGPALPKPNRVLRNNDSLEARMNATNDALQPHAGGQIEHWSDAVAGEIRDDQGICVHNPDTDVFMKYTLAGAYDSNIALILSVGDSRLTSYERMAEILRVTTLRGRDLSTNLNFHYGLVHWFLNRTVHARPTTKFIVPYLTAVGELAQDAKKIDLEAAWKVYSQRNSDTPGSVLEAKKTLILRPLQKLLDCPHTLSGWLSANKDAFSVDGDKITFAENPIDILVDTYHFLNLDDEGRAAASEQIWSHDAEILDTADAFYLDAINELDVDTWDELCGAFGAQAPEGVDADTWTAIQGAHKGHQAGLSLLLLLPALAHKTGFYDLCVNRDLSIFIPERLLDDDHQEAMAKALAPPPVANADEIVATSGGMFYGREAPGEPLYAEAGTTFKAGDPLFIVEVMKMFNKVNAPFDGVVDEVLVEGDGVIIKKGQPIFKVTPSERPEVLSEAEIRARREASTAVLMDAIA
ncbi:biotin carboxylase [Candidatus Paraluminiphilus aquimaris]|uniref:Biotin carboxylase n=1 Tax=Candidatus Paraluminiphilus aquimaris TaxID=2518994 RepID=A0ABY6Q830_9GAMM|nr:biotin/lipoyl-containing protein [Candidatus Paraluminiphilus aquimaris]UZP74831.1 biotin carboxylase [Candidatus Paraluminiphilus aquimaris]